MNNITIAIDGPSGAGKSTVARMLAEKLGISHLDTGAMYRALTYKILEEGVDPEDQSAVSSSLKDFAISFDKNKVLLDGRDISEDIRKDGVTKNVSLISSYPKVREDMVKRQRKIADKKSCVLDGRDIGTVVLPNASYKFYLTASPEIRAKRRYKESKSDMSLDQILEDILRRDNYDSHREISPLKKAEDAILIDSTNMKVEEVVKEMMEYIND